MDEVLEVLAFLELLARLQRVIRGEQRDFGGAAIALRSLQPNDRHVCRGTCTPPCPSCDEKIILGDFDGETGL